MEKKMTVTATKYQYHKKDNTYLTPPELIQRGLQILALQKGEPVADKFDCDVCCSDEKTAGLIREHNNAQIIAFGARIIDNEQAFKLVDAFLNTPFSNGERHNRRIAMIHEIEER